MSGRSHSTVDALAGETSATVERPPGTDVHDGDGAVVGSVGPSETDSPDREGSIVDGQATVLHVDDDPAMGRLVADYFDRADPDVTVHTETDVAAALERVDAGDVDCVVTDLEMPGMDGFDLLGALSTSHPGLPVVVFSSRSRRSVDEGRLGTILDDYVQKLGGADQFEAVVDTVLETLH